jgi:hypothetical protein
MKKIIIGIIVSTFTLLTSQFTKAQGTMTYLSNLDQTSTGSEAVGSNSWVATDIMTGTHIGGYLLNSIQLAMTNTVGNPSGFTVMIYSAFISGGITPGSSLGTLIGSSNPATIGTYTYTPASSIILSQDTPYFIVLTAGTAVANGAYEWSLAGANTYNPSNGWRAGGVYGSSDGLFWNSYAPGGPQFALTATPVPEPSASILILLGGGVLIYIRRKWKRRLRNSL